MPKYIVNWSYIKRGSSEVFADSEDEAAASLKRAPKFEDVHEVSTTITEIREANNG